MNLYYHLEWHDGSRWCLLSTHEGYLDAYAAITRNRREDPEVRYRLTPTDLF